MGKKTNASDDSRVRELIETNINLNHILHEREKNLDVREFELKMLSAKLARQAAQQNRSQIIHEQIIKTTIIKNYEENNDPKGDI